MQRRITGALRARGRGRDFAEPVREVLGALQAPEQVHFGAIEDVVPDMWGEGRVLLIGDAAHAMSPNMACGVAMAVEDAIVLAELLAQGIPAPEVLARFRQRRTTRVHWVRAQTNRRDRVRGLLALVRDAFLRFSAEQTYRANYRPLLDPP